MTTLMDLGRWLVLAGAFLYLFAGLGAVLTRGWVRRVCLIVLGALLLACLVVPVGVVIWRFPGWSR